MGVYVALRIKTLTGLNCAPPPQKKVFKPFVFTNDLIKYADTVMSFLEQKKTSLQAWTGPEVSRRLKLPDFMTVGT